MAAKQQMKMLDAAFKHSEEEAENKVLCFTVS